ncbi:transcription termination factor NusA [Candidatus Persebacteraceae bacterium Df01]|jgi:N utilization substance protein A|uniref:Transcription termination/antitermination protein NusA n=1 Tax=Candidatus Doriopsillibacter californiensis TaxID=2970740 RepID=A0ABT7QM75_9GAMM|nr:transcription termination factor NusA [Candidatus Persebacteraceae bacterium Df01]
MDIGGADLLMYIQSISREKDLPFDQVLDIFSDSLAYSLRRSANDTHDAEFRVNIDSVSGQVDAFRKWRVLADDELMENPQAEIMLESAQEIKTDVVAGEWVEKSLENQKFNTRPCVHSAKQNFNIRLREAEKQRLLNDLLARNEELVNGQVLRVLRDTGDVIVEVLRLECRLPKSQMIPRETLKAGDRVQALIKDINNEATGQPVILTRISPRFLTLLFQRVVPEIEKGILEIIAAVRDPGNRAKIAVRSNDARVDPVGTCVGIRGSRVQSVTNELNGERIDIIPWDDDDAKYVLLALAPAEVTKISVDRDKGSMDVLVDPDRLAQAIGKNGVNVRLASELTGWRLNLKTMEEYEAALEEETSQNSARLGKALNLEEDAARILFEEGFETLEHVAFAEEEELLEIQGFQPDVVREIQTRAREQVEKEESELQANMEKQESALVTLVSEFFPDSEEILRELAKNDVLKVADLADLAADELQEFHKMPNETAAACVLLAREQAYNINDLDEETTV